MRSQEDEKPEHTAGELTIWKYLRDIRVVSSTDGEQDDTETLVCSMDGYFLRVRTTDIRQYYYKNYLQ